MIAYRNSNTGDTDNVDFTAAPVNSLYHQHFDAPTDRLQRAAKTLSIEP